MMNVKDVIKQWKSLAAEVEAVDYSVSGYDYSLKLDGAKLPELARFMLKEGFYLVDLMAVHVTPAIEVVYQFAHFETRCRVLARAFVVNNELPSITDTYQGANWHEREARDLHGVVFTDHPNLEPLILAEEDVDLKPLLKDDNTLKDVGAIRRQPPEPKVAKPEVVKSQEQS